jgi:hypothetical protein
MLYLYDAILIHLYSKSQYSDIPQVIISTELSTINNRQCELQIPWRHEAVLVRRLVEELAQVAEIFQVLGSTVVTFNPSRVGLPFAGICILIRVRFFLPVAIPTPTHIVYLAHQK